MVSKLHEEAEFWIATVLTPLLTVVIKLVEILLHKRKSRKRNRRAPAHEDRRIYAFDLSDMEEEERKSDPNAKMV